MGFNLGFKGLNKGGWDARGHGARRSKNRNTHGFLAGKL